MTTKLQVKGSWNEVKGKLKQKYGQLTDDDLSFAEGEEDELLGRLQRRLGKSKEDLRAEIENCSRDNFQLLTSASALISRQAQIAPPAAKSAPANMTARKTAT